ncbi:methyltransferase family protein [Parasphingopyxis lamellibrachiae]|uniref:Protein-S-isoprenylcysteine O-methyltransferase Ste14 n=1 Tax=Parasphingopyxis lamellibrachiae TaxID=680125 RepID=A0A3D9FG00_9SPHN|nr:isoprenylcysteine carboxylmethyltransferase family protein [Parasphingopyxis lamellibrachiae]RED16709.1 protein-S-isoprenylcysteine O-methyltransferase Ste14 [Parasphingopyxis lamellibrachiae]
MNLDLLPHILFGISLSSVCIILLLSLAAARLDNFQFWPPPSGKSWQHKSFLILFRCFLYPLIVLSVLEFDISSIPTRYVAIAVGVLLSCVGFGFAVRITLRMGWRNAFGEKRGLVTDGYFSKSRNPVYVATWVGLVGWGLIANSILVSILLGFWAVLYLFAPIFEEPWLEQMYGDKFRAYREQVRRFF